MSSNLNVVSDTTWTVTNSIEIKPMNWSIALFVLLSALEKKGFGYVATGMVQYFGKEKVSEGYKKYEKWINKVCAKNSFYEEIYRECVVASPNWMMHKEDFDLISV